MREIVFDTETTGFDPEAGDRVVEIGCVELINQIGTGNVYHVYINPERDMPQGAFEVHGLSQEFLSDKPVFADIIDDFIDFVGDDGILIAHNAPFDMRFINAELGFQKRPPYPQNRVIDTLALAKRKHPMGPNSLDALCNRYGIDNSRREKHGALLDAELLAEVYVELLGGKQRGLDLNLDAVSQSVAQITTKHRAKQRAHSLPSRLSDQDRERHRAFMNAISNETLWHKIWEEKN